MSNKNINNKSDLDLDFVTGGNHYVENHFADVTFRRQSFHRQGHFTDRSFHRQ